MSLFQTGDFVLHSGGRSQFLIDCNVLAQEDFAALAAQIVLRIPRFRVVEGVPRGGLALARALAPYGTGNEDDPLLIVDDVLTKGTSLEKQRAGRKAIGVVIFARHPITYPWITALFQMTHP